MANARQRWDDEQIARAVGYTTSRFEGRGRYDTRRFDDLAAALADAAGNPRAMVYAVTPEGFTIHITNGDQVAQEPDMTATTISYSSKSNAVRAARAALKAKHSEPLSGVHFRLEAVGDEWAWHEMDVGTGQVAAGELLEDGVNPDPQPPAPPVTVVAPKETRDQKRLRKIAEADARNKAKAAAPKPPKAEKAATAAKAPKAGSQRAELMAAAERGELPTPPDFSAETHKRFRPKLQKLVELATAGDLKGLKADDTQPISSSRSAMCRYRDLAIVALEAQRKAAKTLAAA